MLYRLSSLKFLSSIELVSQSDDKHVHLRIYRDFKGNVSLHSHQGEKSQEDEIEYF